MDIEQLPFTSISATHPVYLDSDHEIEVEQIVEQNDDDREEDEECVQNNADLIQENMDYQQSLLNNEVAAYPNVRDEATSESTVSKLKIAKKTLQQVSST